MTQTEKERDSSQPFPDSELLLNSQGLQPEAPAQEHYSSVFWSQNCKAQKWSLIW